MGFLGYKLGLTPNLDALASRSAVFTRAYSQVPLTTPSHATLLTGTYPQFHHVSDMGTALPRDVPYLPDILSRRGYGTAAFVGSQVLDPKSVSAPGFDRGFGMYDAGFHGRRLSEDRYHSVERRAMVVVDHALAWARGRPHEPFFLWVHFYDPHDPYDPPPPFKTRYASSPYDGEIAYMDAALGRLLAGLRSLGVYDRSLIAVAADHGEAFGEHGEQSHGLFLYDDTLHVPLLIKLPGKNAGEARVAVRVGLVDLAPTILEGLGIAPPAAMQGASLLRLMKDAARQAARSEARPDRPEYSETDYPHRAFGWSALRAWRAGKYLYVDAPKPELYDQLSDPAASHNLVDTAPAVADTMAAQLADFGHRTGRAGPAPAPLTPAQAAQLQALGYVNAEPEKTTGAGEAGRGPDPKDKVEISNGLHQALLDNEAEHYREAIPQLERVLREQPNLAIANLQLGRAWNGLEEYGKALPWLRKAVELTPESPEARYELAAALGETGDWPGAASQLETALHQQPDSDELHFYLGSAYEEMEHIPQAMNQYRAALQINPDHYRANLLLGRLLAMQNEFKGALPYLEKAVQLQPQSADAHKILGNAYAGLGQNDKARREQAEAQRLKATTPP